ncbi:RimK family alpha-L-glutamate ligase [Geojedonia litorea]|uniref:RimK family alpha-L-glutamate ligase n=1 Tax=Geojedonia litorea TaxID=1268269 RepID=A0ABV9N084_9FLAO
MNKRYDLVLLTDQRYLEDSKTNAYKHNVFYEDYLVKEALDKLGLKTLRLAWDNPNFDWSSTKAILFRTTWDYFDRFEEFSNWLSKVTKVTRAFNSENLIRWNIDKHYLQDLKANGVTIAETYFIEQKDPRSLEDLHNHLGWKETVLKPCISGAARHTYKLNAQSIADYEDVYKKLIEHEAMMLQPFQYSIVSKGEISMMVFNGQFTHAVLKKAKAGDFRVQDDFGGSVFDYVPTNDEIQFSEQAVKACPELPIYARVDIFTDNNGKIALSELELIEPELWFRNHVEAANVLAKALKEQL